MLVVDDELSLINEKVLHLDKLHFLFLQEASSVGFGLRRFLNICFLLRRLLLFEVCR
jgi:hypothetical protein